MKLLLANYRYFISGGPERYLFNVSDALTQRGHTVVPFSVRYERNRPTPYAPYFVPPLGDERAVLFHEQRLTPATVARTVARTVYARDVERAVGKLVQDSRPDAAYILHYLRKLSPSLLVGLKRAELPIVVRLSDYAMVCPQAHCLRGGKPCTQCVSGNLWSSVRYRCVKNSLAASALNALATWYHRSRRYFDLIDVFVTTTPFMYQMMRSTGVPARRLRHIPTFVDMQQFYPTPTPAAEKYVVYAGRFTPEKGLHVLIDAFAQLYRQRPDAQVRLKIAGWGDAAYRQRIDTQIAQATLQNVVQFVGALDTNGVAALLRNSFVTVVPSLWFENLPNVILESYASGTPVLASKLGSLPLCVADGETGYLFEAGDATHLAERLAHCLDRPDKIADMARQARIAAETQYGGADHIAQLESLFTSLV